MSLGLGKVLNRQSLGQGGPAMGHPYAGATHRLSGQRPVRLLSALDRLAQQPREGLTWTLTPSQRAPLRRALEAVPYDPLGGQAYIQAVRAVMQRCLPKTWLQSLADQALSASARTFIAMQNAPFTPVAANAQAKPDHLT